MTKYIKKMLVSVKALAPVGQAFGALGNKGILPDLPLKTPASVRGVLEFRHRPKVQSFITNSPFISFTNSPSFRHISILLKMDL